MYINKIKKFCGVLNKGELRMYAELANSRPKYTDNEISFYFNQKRLKDNESLEQIANRFNVNVDIIRYLDENEGNLSMDMIEIASKYLDISYDELTEILVDDNEVSCRGNNKEDAQNLISIVNIMFNEMIMQKKLSI